MRKMMMGLIVLVAVGCGDESGEALARSLIDSKYDALRFECECFFEEYGYTSEADCLADLATDSEKSCLAAAYTPVTEMNPRHVECIRDVTRAVVACIERIGCEVTVSQRLRCQTRAVENHCGGIEGLDSGGVPLDTGLSGLGQERLCFGLSDAAFTECEAEDQRADIAAEACEPD